MAEENKQLDFNEALRRIANTPNSLLKKDLEIKVNKVEKKVQADKDKQKHTKND